MKKLPLALGALAISTVSVAGMASPTFATYELRIPYNAGNLDELLLKITRLNLKDNTISFIAEDMWPTGLSSTYMEIHSLDNERRDELSMDSNYTFVYGVGYRSTGTWSLFDSYMRKVNAAAGVETTIPSDKLLAPLTDTESRVIYYLGQVGSHGMAGGKIDFSRCVDSSTYRVAMEIAAPSDVVECWAEMNTDGEGYHYQPYYNGERLTIPADEEAALDAAALARMRAADARDAEAKAAEGGVDTQEGESGGETGGNSDDGAGVDETTSVSVVEKTETGAKNTTATGAEQGNVDGGVAENVVRGVASGTHYAYATVTSEGSASGNSENTGATNENATDAEVWAVDESKVWEDDAGTEVVETPELGEEDCGHFWPLVIGWGLAILGWGSAAIMVLRKRK